MKTSVRESSIAAYRGIPVKQLATQADRIFDIVHAYCNSWGGDLSLNEIKKLHQRLHGDIELSTISARVNALVAAGRLKRLEKSRKCEVTGRGIYPVRLPVKQAELPLQ